MTISPLFLAVRAIGAEFASRLFLPAVLVTGGALVALLGTSIWLVTLSAWWWFLLAPIILITLVCIFAAVIAGLALQLLAPPQTKAQRSQVRTFVDGLQETSEAAQTPVQLLLARIVWDMLFPKEKSYIEQLSGTALSLTSSFAGIVTYFNDQA